MQASEANRDKTGYPLGADFQQPRHVLGSRAGSLPRNGVEHRADEERIPARRRFERSAEGFVWLQTVQLACEHSHRRTPERLGADGGSLRVGDELCDEIGITTLAFWRPRPSGDEERNSVEPSCQVEKPPQGWVSAQWRSSIASRVGCSNATLAASQ